MWLVNEESVLFVCIGFRQTSYYENRQNSDGGLETEKILDFGNDRLSVNYRPALSPA